MVQQVRGATEWAEALRSAEAVLVGFTAPWCRNCEGLAPALAAAAAAGHRWLRVCAVDAEEVEEVAERCEVTAVPLAQLWVRGAKVREVRGADADAVRELVREGEEKVAASSA